MKNKLQRLLMDKMTREEQASVEKTLSPEDCAAIFGTNPQKSAYTLWAEKTGLVAPEKPGEAERFSGDTRDYIAGRFAEASGKSVRRVNALLRNPAYPYAHAVLHHLVLGEDAGLTCETATRLNLERFHGKLYPGPYYYACLHRMMVTGRKRWYLAVLIPKKELKIFVFTADPDELRCLALGEEQFWRRVQEQFAPLLDGSASTRRTLDLMYFGGKQGQLDLSPISLQVHDYLRWQEREEEAKDALRDRAATIKSFLGDYQEGRLGDIRVTWTPEEEKTFDFEALLKDYPQLELEKYRTPQKKRVMQVYRGGRLLERTPETGL